ncbi:uncharacterized protein ARMOST_01572 [Armillaria ostoyae]|uniref:Uncharacterized protein n=1 Tax=Armillaria ostoyae TaxID=47428 RepID=A0A284QPC3_ARMOS|nr:uncharacterized protein ARMOST_01572 [Armillaria ostoyae]
MATQADIPSDVTDNDKAGIFQFLDASLNSIILMALLYGMYTGILAVTLWNISINKCWRIQRALVVVIIFLHALITISVAVEWSLVRSALHPGNDIIVHCLGTVLIIYRILTVTGVKRGAGGRFGVFRRFIKVLVESSALYSISLIVYLALNIRNDFGLLYLEVIAGIAKGVAPTLIIGRAAAGHTCPNDDYDESTVSSLHFQAPSEVGTTSFQESTMESTVLEIDIEAQQEQSDELVVIVERA